MKLDQNAGRAITLTKTIIIATFLILASEANATIITVEPDDYALWADLSHVGPGATLSVFTNFGSNTARFESVFGVHAPLPDNNPSAPTGSLVFGSAEPRYSVGNFRNIRAAERCIATGNCSDLSDSSRFSVFRIDFDRPTDFVEVLSGFDDDYPDPITFSAYDRLGTLVASCRGGGGGHFPASTQIGDTDGRALDGSTCGVRTEFRNLEGAPEWGYDADQYFRFTLERAQTDIAYVMYGSPVENWTPSIVDRLSYGVNSVPEPGTLVLFGLGLAGIGFARKRKEA